MVQRSKAGSSLSHTYDVHAKVKVKDKDTYVFDTALNKDSNGLAVSLSSNSIQLYTLETLQEITCLTGHNEKITGIKFSQQDQNNLYSSSHDGTICVWDIRKNQNPVMSFKDDTDEALKPLASFDFNQDESFICAGTEIIREDAFLLFWDTRTTKLLGGYWNSHRDDVTDVKFHPAKKTHMASGSVDGLINVFDLNESCEDDALVQTLNTGSSVGKLAWFLVDGVEKMSCITHIEEHQLWDIDETKIISTLDRDSLTKLEKAHEVDYLIGSYQSDQVLHLATGTNSGNVDVWAVSDEQCNPWIKLYGCHTAVVRSILWNNKYNTLVTGGEDGLICCWKSDSHDSILQHESSSVGKVESHLKSVSIHHKKKPYTKTC